MRMNLANKLQNAMRPRASGTVSGECILVKLAHAHTVGTRLLSKGTATRLDRLAVQNGIENSVATCVGIQVK